MMLAVIIVIVSQHQLRIHENANVRISKCAREHGQRETSTGTRVSTSTGSHSICYRYDIIPGSHFGFVFFGGVW